MICMSIFQIISTGSTISRLTANDTDILPFTELTLSKNHVLWIIEAIVQSTFISKALHRVPKRITGWIKVVSPCYLAVVLAAFNLGMWVVDTIAIESVGEDSVYSHDVTAADTRIESAYYGETVWIWVKLLLFPLIVFFRIHSLFTLFRVFDIHSHITMAT